MSVTLFLNRFYLVPNASDIPTVHGGMLQLALGSKANHIPN